MIEMASNSDDASFPKRKCSIDVNATEVFCPHCQAIVSRSTYYRHQVLYLDYPQESQRSTAESVTEETFVFEDERLATGKRLTSTTTITIILLQILLY